MTQAVGAIADIGGSEMFSGSASGPRSISDEQAGTFRTMLKQGTTEGADFTDPSLLAALVFNNMAYATGIDVLAKCAGSAVAGVNKLTSVG